jgi:PAS domain S-box-containing protein
MNNDTILADQVRKLYDHTVFGSAATLINGSILVLVLRDHVRTLNLGLWLAAAVLASMIRLSLYWRFRNAQPPPGQTRKWKNLFIASLFLSGLVWGATAIFLFPPGATGHQAFVAFVAGGMVAGAVGSFTAVLSAYYLFSVAALAPIIVRFFLMGSEIHIAMGTMTLLFLLIMSITALRTHRDFIALLALRYENRDLVEGLRQEVRQRTQAEADLLKRNQQIEEIVATRTAELKAAVEHLREEIQARQKVAHTLKENQQRMQAIIGYAPLIIWAIDRNGVFTFSEGKGLELIGLKGGEAVGQSLFEMFRDDAPTIQNARRVLAGEPVSGPTSYKGVIFENRYEPIVSDAHEIVGAIGVAIDITAQQKAQEALRRGEEKYRELVENINDVLFTIDPDGRTTYISPMVEPLFGYRPEEVLDRPFLELVDATDRARIQVDFEKTLGKEARVNEYRLVDKSGQIKWCRVSIRSITENGSRVGVQGILSDITQSKHLEEQLQRAHKMEALGFLAGGVAHDLNNILSGIVSYPDLLLLDLPQDSPLYEPLVTIRASGERAAAIVQDLLTLARRGVSSTALLNLNAIIESYLQSPEFKTLKALFPEMHIEKSLQPDLFNLIGSGVHVSKTLMNLVSNAAEAMPRGGTITIRTANQYIDQTVAGFETVVEGEYVVLSVTDAGVGIAEEDLERIFEPFYTKKVMGRSGSGLGMAVVWGTVKDHGGYINVRSRKGAGSSFELYFPATRRSLPETSRNVSHESYRGHGESILVIDDVKHQREIAAMMLGRLGYRPEAVAGGEAAIDYLAHTPADLLLLDMIMAPGMDGLETYQQVLKINPRQKAIIVSGYSETDRVRQTQALGAGEYLKKPYSLEALGLAIKKELAREWQGGSEPRPPIAPP